MKAVRAVCSTVPRILRIFCLSHWLCERMLVEQWPELWVFDACRHCVRSRTAFYNRWYLPEVSCAYKQQSTAWHVRALSHYFKHVIHRLEVLSVAHYKLVPYCYRGHLQKLCPFWFWAHRALNFLAKTTLSEDINLEKIMSRTSSRVQCGPDPLYMAPTYIGQLVLL